MPARRTDRLLRRIPTSGLAVESTWQTHGWMTLGASFHRFPARGTKRQASGDCWGVQPVVGAAVTEGLLSHCASPVVLHIATHGFFLPANRGLVRSGSKMDHSLSSVLSGLDDPMLRSGLATAGANAWLRGDRLSHDIQDGLLAAEEVSAIDLRRTELTVLSACETALGDIDVGQGVLGLRRAFVLAGTRSLVTTLWKVPDVNTGELMDTFYRNLLDGMTRAAALRNAQLAIFEVDPAPRNWAAFVFKESSARLNG